MRESFRDALNRFTAEVNSKPSGLHVITVPEAVEQQINAVSYVKAMSSGRACAFDARGLDYIAHALEALAGAYTEALDEGLYNEAGRISTVNELHEIQGLLAKIEALIKAFEPGDNGYILAYRPPYLPDVSAPVSKVVNIAEYREDN